MYSSVVKENANTASISTGYTVPAQRGPFSAKQYYDLADTVPAWETAPLENRTVQKHVTKGQGGKQKLDLRLLLMNILERGLQSKIFFLSSHMKVSDT